MALNPTVSVRYVSKITSAMVYVLHKTTNNSEYSSSKIEYASYSLQQIKVVSFNGDGFLELKSQPLRKTCNFGFSFNTMQENCLLVLSAFKGNTGWTRYSAGAQVLEIKYAFKAEIINA